MNPEQENIIGSIGGVTTNGTYKTGLYKNLLLDLGYDVVIPDLIFQNEESNQNPILFH